MHPVLLQTKYFTINTLWIFIAIALIITTFSIIKLSEKNNLKVQFLSEQSWKLILWMLIGARIFSLIQNYQTYFYELNKETFFQLFYIWDKGLSLFGALLALFLVLAYLCKNKEQNFWKWLDVFVPSIIFGLAIGHLGTFFEGTNYGKETSLPWGVNFESPAIKYTVPIHPTQIYAFIYTLILGITLIIIGKTEKIRDLKPGFLGLVGIIAYCFLQFLERFIRGDDALTIFGIRIDQIAAFLITISFGILLYLRYNNPKKKSKTKTTKK